ncbi:CRISPR system Cascade subunit CasC [Methylobrevis pamukkalensis]|uniref:CRISPR system Cascade subunit CasC n=1 Tax=Methylobrevis pamukkalensis TaxID=1439726 RepID=A0A1E3GUF6_9HYPH|nr:CRISPR system Cascade subunit CasC [Methylobrevis pamukkalensis]
MGVAKKGESEFQKQRKENIAALRSAGKLPGGLTAALFGRMVTSDPRANIDAPVHVAHAFTVHTEETESDYFIAADDLARDDESGADTIQETELTSGLFYGYVVVDIPGLLGNLAGDAQLAGAVLHNLLYLIAEVSPGAKLGSTAPYSRASFLLVEAGDRQPRSLAEAFRTPCAANAGVAVAKLSEHLANLDAVYATGEDRRFLSLANTDVPGAERGTLADLAAFVRDLPQQQTDVAA